MSPDQYDAVFNALAAALQSADPAKRKALSDVVDACNKRDDTGSVQLLDCLLDCIVHDDRVDFIEEGGR